MLNTPLDQWRPKFEEVGQIFGKEKETKEWFKKYDEKASKLHDKIVAKTGEATFMKMVDIQMLSVYTVTTVTVA